MNPLRALLSLLAPYALGIAAVAGGLAFLVGGSCAERRHAVELAAHRHTSDSLAAVVAERTAERDAAAVQVRRDTVIHRETVTRWRTLTDTLPPVTVRESVYVATADTALAACDTAVASLTAQAVADSALVATLRAALAHEQDEPAGPRFRRYIAPGYDVTHGAPLGALGAQYRVAERFEIHARGERTFAPVNESRLVVMGHVYF